MEIIDFGLSKYEDVLPLQIKNFEDLISRKIKGETGREVILLGEHFPVITLGRRALSSNILVGDEELRREGIQIFNIGRGGDVTYHAPGQLIVYPIFDLDRRGLGVKDYVSVLEDIVINLLYDYGIKGERKEGAPGVWVDPGSPKERKICALGIKCSRFCTMHGFALNVNTDLSGFQLINPCGFKDSGVTSIEKENGRNIKMEELKQKVVEELKKRL